LSSEGARERPRLQLAKRTVPTDKPVEDPAPAAASSIFGGAKPVDTAKKEREIEEKLKATTIKEPEPPKKPTSTDIFGAAKPVDTARKEREIEERLRKKQEEEESRLKKEDETETGEKNGSVFF